jgi:hypothetical protein
MMMDVDLMANRKSEAAVIMQGQALGNRDVTWYTARQRAPHCNYNAAHMSRRNNINLDDRT